MMLRDVLFYCCLDYLIVGNLDKFVCLHVTLFWLGGFNCFVCCECFWDLMLVG